MELKIKSFLKTVGTYRLLKLTLTLLTGKSGLKLRSRLHSEIFAVSDSPKFICDFSLVAGCFKLLREIEHNNRVYYIF